MPSLFQRFWQKEVILFHSGEWTQNLNFIEATWLVVVNYCYSYLYVITWMCLQEPFEVSKCYTTKVFIWWRGQIPPLFLYQKLLTKLDTFLRGVTQKLCLKNPLLVCFSIFKHSQYFSKYSLEHGIRREKNYKSRVNNVVTVTSLLLESAVYLYTQMAFLNIKKSKYSF